MAAEASTQREMQEKSIKARKTELYVNGEADSLEGPRKTFRQVLKETPATPLSKNVKLMLWGSAAPVVLLFLGALLAGNSSSRAKAPEGLIVPDRARQTADAAAKADLARLRDNPPPAPAAEVKPEEPKPDAAAKPEGSQEDKDKPKPQNPKKTGKGGKGKGGKGKSTPKPKEDTAVAKTDEAPKADEGARNDEPKPTPKPDSSASRSRSKPEPEPEPTPASKSASTTANNDEPKGDTTSAASSAPKKSLFKKKKPPVFSYPKRDGADKKAEPGSSPGMR